VASGSIVRAATSGTCCREDRSDPQREGSGRLTPTEEGHTCGDAKSHAQVHARHLPILINLRAVPRSSSVRRGRTRLPSSSTLPLTSTLYTQCGFAEGSAFGGRRRNSDFTRSVGGCRTYRCRDISPIDDTPYRRTLVLQRLGRRLEESWRAPSVLGRLRRAQTLRPGIACGTVEERRVDHNFGGCEVSRQAGSFMP